MLQIFPGSARGNVLIETTLPPPAPPHLYLHPPLHVCVQSSPFCDTPVPLGYDLIVSWLNLPGSCFQIRLHSQVLSSGDTIHPTKASNSVSILHVCCEL